MADMTEVFMKQNQETEQKNPFNVILGRWNEAEARRLKEDEDRKKEEADLKKSLMGLQYEYNYKKELEKIKGDENRKDIVLRGLTEGKIEQSNRGEDERGVFGGTPFESITKKKSPIIQKQQIKDTNDLAAIVKKNEETSKYIDEALEATDKIPQGKAGQINIGYQKMFNPKNPILGEWQKIKSVLSDLQLGKLQFTKGAISDREMDFFSKAVANDEIMSAPKIKLILNRAKEAILEDTENKKRVYIKNYEEDPDEFLYSKKGVGNASQQTQKKTITLPSGKTISIGQ